MINGVLVERTVKDVMPQLKTNAEGLKKVLDDLLKQYSGKQEELEKWKVCYQSFPWLQRSSTNACAEEEQDPGRATVKQYACFG